MKRKLKLVLKRAIFIMAPFVFIACEKPNDLLGLNQVIGGDSTALGKVEFNNIVAYTASIDSLLVALSYDDQRLIGGYGGNRMVGSETDGFFGRNQSSFVSQLILNQVDPDFGTNPIIDSVKLFLKYSGAYGDTSKIMDIEVFELDEVLNRDTTFFSNYTPTLGQKIGEKMGFIPRPNTKVVIEDNSTESTLKIDMDASYFQTKFADVGDGTFASFASNDDLVEYFKGIVVISPSVDASTLYFKLNDGNSRMVMYFRNDEGDTNDIELNFNQNKTTTPMNFNLFEQDFEGYPSGFDLASLDTINGEIETYVQAMGGVATVVTIPGLDSLMGQNLIINKAILDVHKSNGTGFALSPPQRLEIRNFVEGTTTSTIKDFSIGNTFTGDGAYRTGSLRSGFYRFDITKYVYEVVNGAETGKIALVPSIKSTAAHRTILQGSGADKPMKLTVYYTQP